MLTLDIEISKKIRVEYFEMSFKTLINRTTKKDQTWDFTLLNKLVSHFCPKKRLFCET